LKINLVDLEAEKPFEINKFWDHLFFDVKLPSPFLLLQSVASLYCAIYWWI